MLPEDLLSILDIEKIEKIFLLNKYITYRVFCFTIKIGIGYGNIFLYLIIVVHLIQQI